MYNNYCTHLQQLQHQTFHWPAMERAVYPDATVPSTVILPMGGFMTSVEEVTLPKQERKVCTVMIMVYQ
jgi:hypothetical protein